jgi:hypothetical protein
MATSAVCKKNTTVWVEEGKVVLPLISPVVARIIP